MEDERSLPFVSSATGTWMTDAEATEPDYWSNPSGQTVSFTQELQTVLTGSSQILLEVGPGRTLSTRVKQGADPLTKPLVLSSLLRLEDQPSDAAFFSTPWAASGWRAW